MKDKFPKERFNLREAKGVDYYKVMMVNESLKDYKYKHEFPWLLYFDIELKDMNGPFRLPTSNEANTLNELEDDLELFIKSSTPYHFVGRVTDNGHRELFYYISTPEELHKMLQELVNSKQPIREWEYSIDIDTDWNSVRFFFPMNKDNH